jgi:hypothetical protein
MKAQLIPVFFDPGRDAGFDRQLEALRCLLGGCADFLPPVPLGAPLPPADGVIFPQLLGEAYRCVPAFRTLTLPILVITSEFGTLSMWDWEIICYLKSEGVETLAPYNVGQAEKICRSLRLKRELREVKFLVYQDNPGEGAQAPIFKRFYWWEEECTQRLKDRFGVTILRKSLRELGARAKTIPDEQADETWQSRSVPVDGLSSRAIRGALKLYLAVKQDLQADSSIRAVGMNCLNESHFSDTTPCLAWNLLYEEGNFVWGCEADTLSMVTHFLVQQGLNFSVMMTNLYPFLLGDAALKHERIEKFPEVASRPGDHLLIAHCGYMGVIPRLLATDWTLRPKVLAIVDDNASAIDARLPIGDVTLVKLHPALNQLSVAEGTLTGYVHYPNSDCRNGGIIRVRDGHKLMATLYSHHYLLTIGHNLPEIQLLGKVFGLNLEEI